MALMVVAMTIVSSGLWLCNPAALDGLSNKLKDVLKLWNKKYERDWGQARKSVIPKMRRSERGVDCWEISAGFTTAENSVIVNSQGDQLQLDRKVACKNEEMYIGKTTNKSC